MTDSYIYVVIVSALALLAYYFTLLMAGLAEDKTAGKNNRQIVMLEPRRIAARTAPPTRPWVWTWARSSVRSHTSLSGSSIVPMFPAFETSDARRSARPMNGQKAR